jgi:hypothetical protein
MTGSEVRFFLAAPSYDALQSPSLRPIWVLAIIFRFVIKLSQSFVSVGYARGFAARSGMVIKLKKVVVSMDKPSFEVLLDRFNKACDRDRFALAATLFNEYAGSARKLLPKIQDNQLLYDGKNGQAMLYEWAAVLTAAKDFVAKKSDKQLTKEQLKDKLSEVSEGMIHTPAEQIYKKQTKGTGR